MKNIWSLGNTWDKQKLKKPFFCLAPMAGVTDSPFRQIITKIGKPDLFFTEFVSTEMVSRELSQTENNFRQYIKNLPPILKYSKKEKPLIVQFFGCKPEQFRLCAKLALKLGFDGIDINMGCPDKKVLKQGAGSELIKSPELAVGIIRVVKEVVGDKIPISVKTRIGYDKKDFSHILAIAREGVDAITIHGRTVKQGYTGEADWETIGEIAKEIKKISPDIVVIGNGDVKNLEQGRMLAEKYGLDWVMIGREALHNPWVFDEKYESLRIKDESLRMNMVIKEKLRLCREHTKLFKKHYPSASLGSGGIGAMKKYYKAYLAGISKDIVQKEKIMSSTKISEIEKILKSKI